MFRGFDRIRMKKIKCLLVISLLALVLRLVHIQILRGEHYDKLADDNYYYSLKVTDESFQLLDSNGVYLNNRIKNYKLLINVRLFKLNDYESNLDKIISLNLTLRRLHEDFDLDKLLKKGYGNFYYDLDEEGYLAISEIAKHVKGIFVYSYDTIDNSKAWLIENILSSMHYNDKDGILQKKSKDSLEGQINSFFKEDSVAKASFQVEKSGFILPVGYTFKEAANVNLTIDSVLQNKIKAVMENEKFKIYENIGAVLIEASTGKIKAFVQRDDYKPNINLAAAGLGYEPGSTFKLMIGELALEKGIISEKSTYLCVGDKCKLHNKSNPHGLITFMEAIKYSCNDYFISVSNKLTAEEIKAFAERQGYLNKVLNIDQEVTGSFKLPEDDESNINVALGSNTPATPIQVAASLSAILNEGTYIKPFIIDSFSDIKGNKIKEFETTKEEVISKETAEILKRAMRGTVLGGTGYMANLPSLEVGGKTGSTEKHGWFAGYFKKDSEYYILTVLVPNLDSLSDNGTGYTGGNTAAVVFRDIVLAINQE